MERRHGIVVRATVPDTVASVPDHPLRISRGLVECLSALHSVDIAKHGLTGFGKPAGFLERQVRGWSERWRNAQTAEIPEMNQLMGWLLEHLPVSPAPTLVHNDFKLDNVMLDPRDPGRVEAVLDWEMATIGDPLVDLGIMLGYWGQPSDPGGSEPPITAQPGWLTKQQMVDEYAAHTGRDVSGIGVLRSLRYLQAGGRAAADLLPLRAGPDPR